MTQADDEIKRRSPTDDVLVCSTRHDARQVQTFIVRKINVALSRVIHNERPFSGVQLSRTVTPEISQNVEAETTLHNGVDICTIASISSMLARRRAIPTPAHVHGDPDRRSTVSQS
jgi:hypothetical protein